MSRDSASSLLAPTWQTSVVSRLFAFVLVTTFGVMLVFLASFPAQFAIGLSSRVFCVCVCVWFARSRFLSRSGSDDSSFRPLP